MNREVLLLLAVLRGLPGNVDKDSINWDELLVLAESHGVLPLFCRDYTGELPEIWRDRLRSHWSISARMASELHRLLELFARNAIEVLPLKGPTLAESLYGSLSLRTCDDLDLLVQHGDFGVAQSILIEAGFVPVDEPGNYHRGFVCDDTFVELHFAVSSPSLPRFDIERAWARSKQIDFRGLAVRSFDKADLLLYLVIHGVKHYFARLVWLLDIGRSLSALDDHDVVQLLEMARSTGIEGSLLTTCGLAHLVFGSELPQGIRDAIDMKPSALPNAALIAERALSGPALVGTPAPYASLFVSQETGVRKRWANRLRFLLPTQQDLLWTRQYGIPRSWMGYLRPFRLLWRYGLAVSLKTLFPGSAPGAVTGGRKT